MCFTVAFSEQEYNLVGPDEETTNLWIETLNKVIPIIRIVQQENLYKMLAHLLRLFCALTNLFLLLLQMVERTISKGW